MDDLPFAARPAVIAAVATEIPRPLLVLSSRTDRSDVLSSAVAEFLTPSRTVVHWPAPAALPYERLGRDTEQSADYVAALAQLGQAPASSITFASSASIAHAVMSAQQLAEQTRHLRPGVVVRQGDLTRWAASAGYESVSIVQRVGEFARRGGIIDIFSPGSAGPVRVDFFGDEIDSVRLFDPNSQRSLERLDSLALLPAMELPAWELPRAASAFQKLDLSPLRFEVREELTRTLDRAADGILPAAVDLFAPFLLEEPTTILDHLPSDLLVVLDDSGSVTLAGTQRDQHAREHYQAAVKSHELPAGLPSPYISFEMLMADLKRRQRLAFGAADAPAAEILRFEGWTIPTQFAGRIG